MFILEYAINEVENNFRFGRFVWNFPKLLNSCIKYIGVTILSERYFPRKLDQEYGSMVQIILHLVY